MSEVGNGWSGPPTEVTRGELDTRVASPRFFVTLTDSRESAYGQARLIRPWWTRLGMANCGSRPFAGALNRGAFGHLPSSMFGFFPFYGVT